MEYQIIAIALTLAVALSIPCSAAERKSVRVAMVQMEIMDGDLAENLDRAEAGIREAAKQGAELICLPEAADFGWLWQDTKKDAFPIPGKYTDFISRLAKELKVWISVGCLEKDGENTYNSAVIIDRSGKIALKHRKIIALKDIAGHLYGPGRMEDIKVIDTEFGKIGMTICADNFVAEIPQRVKELGAWLLIAPHGFAAEEDELPKNAQDYQNHICGVAKGTGMWVVGADAVLGTITGGIWKGKLHSGCSTISDPTGKAVAVGKFKETDLVVYDIRCGSVK